MKQVDKDAYNFDLYSDKGRWVSYYHQLREVLKHKPRSILEIGVGDKVFGNYIVSNTDIAYTGIDVAGDLKPDVIGSVEALPFDDNKFDVVCAFEVLEHIPFEKFHLCLMEIKRTTSKVAIISLPHFGPAIKFLLKIPFLPELALALKIPFPQKHKWQGQHHWEIGKKGYSSKKIKNIIDQYFTVLKDFIPFENQYHHFYILEPKR